MQSQAGDTVWQAQNNAFDRRVLVDAINGFNLGFPGQYYNEELGQWYNTWRMYDATTGRYTQSDPIGLGGGINTFAYVGGNPISDIDPTGLVSPNDPFCGLSPRLIEHISTHSLSDYVKVSGSWYIFSFSLSSSGDSLFGSFNISKNLKLRSLWDLFKPSISTTTGILLSKCNDAALRRKLTDKFLQGFSQSVGAYYFGGGGIGYSPGSGAAIETGIGMGVDASPGGVSHLLWQY